MTEITLQRDPNPANATLGRLAIDGVFFCYTLEPPRTADHPCIPAGAYTLYPAPSPKFKREVYRLVNVPGRTDIEIHVGNTAADTHGCILVGFDRANGELLHSRVALDALLAKVPATATITIKDAA